jgi:hypothetical protein
MPGADRVGDAELEDAEPVAGTDPPAVAVPLTCEHDETDTAVRKARARAATRVRRDVGMVRTVQAAPV